MQDILGRAWVSTTRNEHVGSQTIATTEELSSEAEADMHIVGVTYTLIQHSAGRWLYIASRCYVAHIYIVARLQWYSFLQSFNEVFLGLLSMFGVLSLSPSLKSFFFQHLYVARHLHCWAYLPTLVFVHEGQFCAFCMIFARFCRTILHDIAPREEFRRSDINSESNIYHKFKTQIL